MNAKKLGPYLHEYLKCAADFDYFCSTYVKIEAPGKDIPFIPYTKQSELIQEILKNHFVLTLKSRQIGISTIIKAFSAWLCVFHNNVVIGIISKDAPEATDFARGIMNMIDKLPAFLRPTFHKRTERTFILSNGSKCYTSPVNPNAPEKTLRGKAITFLVVDEAAYIKYIDIAWTSLVPALSTNQQQARKNNVPYGTILLSTPNKTVGVGAWFYRKYCDASEGTSAFKSKIIYWRDIPQIVEDPLWYKNICDLFDNDRGKIEQELELKFLSGEGSFFEPEIALKLQEKKYPPIEIVKLFNGEIWKFEQPIPNTYYIIGVDTAPEFGHDNSTIVIFNYDTLEQVWEYKGKLKVNDFIKIVKLACHQYPGMVVIENNSYGNQVMEALVDSEYLSMVYKEKRGTPPNIKFVAGLSTNSKTRPLMINALYTYVTEYPDCIKSDRLKMELLGLIKKSTTSGTRVEAEMGGYDDLALGTSFCHYVRLWDPPKLIDKAKYGSVALELNEIMGMNIRDEMNNDGNLKKYVKENLLVDEKFSGVVDMFKIIDMNRK